MSRDGREWAGNLAALTLGVASSLCIAETVLRIPSLPLPERLGSKLFSCYEEGPHEIAFFEPKTGVRLLRPGFETDCGFGRLKWHHRGDRWGFRNPESWDHVDVVLIGDSFVYGHGVEEDQTIANYLRERTNLRVANLGFTSGSPVEYLVYLRNFALRLNPRIVTVLVFANDIDDIASKRSRAAEQAFVDGNDVPEIGIFPPEALIGAAPRDDAGGLNWLERRLLTYQTWSVYWPLLGEWIRDPSLERPGDEPPLQDPMRLRRQRNRERPLDDAPREEDAGDPLSVAYARKAFRTMADSARAAGVTLVIGYIPGKPRRDPHLNAGMELILGNVTRENGVPFLNLRPLLSGPDGEPLPGDRIPEDGHFTAQGAKRTAGFIAEFLRKAELIR